MKHKLKEITPLPAGIVIGGLVRYYDNGWRVGRLLKQEDSQVGIERPGKHRLVWVNLIDVEAV